MFLGADAPEAALHSPLQKLCIGSIAQVAVSPLRVHKFSTVKKQMHTILTQARFYSWTPETATNICSSWGQPPPALHQPLSSLGWQSSLNNSNLIA